MTMYFRDEHEVWYCRVMGAKSGMEHAQECLRRRQSGEDGVEAHEECSAALLFPVDVPDSTLHLFWGENPYHARRQE